MQVRAHETFLCDPRSRRADDVLAMHRSARRGGTRSLLRWLAGRTGVHVLLIAADGTVLAADGGTGAAGHTELARSGAEELRSRGLGSLALDGESSTALLVSLNGARNHSAPALAALTPRPVPDGLALLLSDVASALDLCWRSEQAERQWRRLELAEVHNREAVLHLLMNGHVATARQIADVLEPPLPDVIRYLVAEAPPRLRSALAHRCAELAPGAWVVPCPVYEDHVLVLAPSAPGAGTEEARALASAVAEASGDFAVGVSEAVPLRDAATGYAQAFHALVTARNRTDRWATFTCRPDPALVLGPTAREWAAQVLTPLRTYFARRPQDPDSTELAVTATSWLAFSSQAATYLKIHRNTLSSRLRLMEHLLSLDLDRLADQSLLALALRADSGPRTRPAGPGTVRDTAPRSLDDLLTRPAAVEWARNLLRPVEALSPATGLGHTLDTWLRNDARLAPTATELSLSTTAVRKRLTRVEELLGRSLLRAPSDRHDLWLAKRALHLTDAARQCAAMPG